MKTLKSIFTLTPIEWGVALLTSIALLAIILLVLNFAVNCYYSYGYLVR